MGSLIKRASRTAEVPSASLADIAFLLLIFFPVATTIDVDTGIGMTLPPALDHPPPPIKERNLLTVWVDGEGRLILKTVRWRWRNCAKPSSSMC